MNDDPTSDERAFLLHMAEYGALRAEILSQQDVRQQTFRHGIGAIVAIWAFLLAEVIKPELVWMEIAAWWLAVPVAAAGLVLNYSAAKGVKQAGAYLAMIEERYGERDLRGWENTLIELRRDQPGFTWPAPSTCALGELRDEIFAREMKTGYSTVIRWIWGIILGITIGVATLASVLVYASAAF